MSCNSQTCVNEWFLFATILALPPLTRTKPSHRRLLYGLIYMARDLVVLAPGTFLREEAAALNTLASAQGRRIKPLPADVLLDDMSDTEEASLRTGLSKVEVIAITEECINGEEPNFVPGLLHKIIVAAMTKCPNLKWFHCGWVGLDGAFFDAFRKNNVRITNSPGVNALPIAHTCMAAVLMLSRGFTQWSRTQATRAWTPLSKAIAEGHKTARPRKQLAGQRVVVLGLGAIGTEIAEQLQFYKMIVCGVKRSRATGDEPADTILHPDSLLEAVADADWLICTVPSTAQTQGMVSAEVISSLPDGACIINMGRGEVVDELAMTKALQSRKLFG